jgi:hypothetical protein
MIHGVIHYGRIALGTVRSLNLKRDSIKRHKKTSEVTTSGVVSTQGIVPPTIRLV